MHRGGRIGVMKRREFLIAGGALATARPALPQGAAKPIRSVQRLFCSDVEDKPWFNDREMWPRYLSMLAENRFTRFNLSFGIGYDFIRQVTDAYFLFTYPFLLDVPGYKVRATNLPDAERDRNLEMLRYISEQTAAHGLEFQLGLWMHGYVWENSPNPNHVIEGLTPESHGPYCRDALAMLLKACPKVTGVNLRIHGESGVTEGSYEFWSMVFDGVKRAGRKLEMDLHAKGIDQNMIDLALATGNPGEGLAEVLGRAPRPAVPSGRHPSQRDSRPRPPRPGIDGAQRRLPQLHPLRLRRLDARGPQVRHPLAHPGPARSACSPGTTPSLPPPTIAPSTSAARRALK